MAHPDKIVCPRCNKVIDVKKNEFASMGEWRRFKFAVIARHLKEFHGER